MDSLADSKASPLTTRPGTRPTMLAFGITRFGPPSVLGLRVIERPVPGPGQLLVRVAAAGVGPWDAWLRAGQSTRLSARDLPATLGSEVSGVVEALGPGVDSLSVGDAVYGCPNASFTNGYAEYAVVQRDMVARMPARLTFVQAASMPVVACTAWAMLFEHADVRAGERLLVLGAAGSVGAFAVQLARVEGARVVATGSPSEAFRLQSLGAHEVIDARSTQDDGLGGPYDAVIDLVGGALQARAMHALAPGGVLVSAVSPPDAVLAGTLEVRGVFFIVSVGSDCLERLAAMVDSGHLVTHVGTELPLGEARRAHEMLEDAAGARPGKIVLTVSGA
ncbi:NADP-dependent oxidoreductase [Variovorax sp. RB3P1]|uniref:NADP-dependent oxidoreductase n=1 Tax=Variovorax sp. RB3P1 TaxID=3443732 RepID=UPI003F48D736